MHQETSKTLPDRSIPQPTNVPSPLSNATIQLSPDQQIAYNHLLKWQRGMGELTLGGYAGTGKTTLIKKLVHEVPDYAPEYAVLSLTGKAVSVLRKKGVWAHTIHSTIYNVTEENKQPVFTLKSRLEDVGAIIVDEASMVNVDLYRDLLSFKLPILWVGDHGQLEPVGESPELMKDPQVRLEKIHRQAEGNPIIQLSAEIRNGTFNVNAYQNRQAENQNENVRFIRKNNLQQDDLVNADQIICAFNKTRIKINDYVRKLKGYGNSGPVIGDKVICLKNNRNEGLFNGLQGVIKEVESSNNYWRLSVLLDDNRVWKGIADKQQFGHEKGLVENSYKKATFWDYSYAVTCHKAQGSEWPFVIVIDEPCRVWDMKRWRYTAVTRASERLLYATL